MYRTIVVLGISMASTATANAWDYYAAIAYSPSTGNTGWSYGYSSQDSAQAMALQKCNASDARIAVCVRNGYCALAKGNGPGYFYGWASTQSQAELNAVTRCAAKMSGAHIVTWAFSGLDSGSDGSYWYYWYYW
jgi:hypothetical protein